jgi:hypothetical protein
VTSSSGSLSVASSTYASVRTFLHNAIELLPDYTSSNLGSGPTVHSHGADSLASVQQSSIARPTGP